MDESKMTVEEEELRCPVCVSRPVMCDIEGRSWRCPNERCPLCEERFERKFFEYVYLYHEGPAAALESVKEKDAEIKSLKGDCEFLRELITDSLLGKELVAERENAKALVEALENVHKLPRTTRISSGKMFSWAKEILASHRAVEVAEHLAYRARIDATRSD